LSILIGFIALVWLFKEMTSPKVKYSKDNSGRENLFIEYQSIPSPLEFYTRMITSLNNLTKSSFLPNGVIPPKCEVVVKAQPINKESYKSYLKVCGFPTDREEVPAPYHIGISLPVVSAILTHPCWPIKPLATMIHVKQTISMLRPIKSNEIFFKRFIFGQVRNTERGTEMDGIVQLFTDSNYEEKSIVMQGVASLLILKKRGAAQQTQPQSQETNQKETKKYEIKLEEALGRKYAAATGDYNPWHLNSITAKIFGFKRAICHGMWSLSKVLSLIQDDIPSYPLFIEAEWKKPMFFAIECCCFGIYFGKQKGS